jgi:ABC-type sulfate transport system substrate-binding protein
MASHHATAENQSIEVIDGLHTDVAQLSHSTVPDQDSGVHNEIAVHTMHDTLCEAHGKPLVNAQPCR